MRIGVIGYGYWGPNIVRNFHSQDNCKVVLVADRNPKCEERLKKMFPSVAFTSDENQILTSREIDVVAVVTPVWTHFELAKKALENGKHVFVEKPFTYTVAQGEELVELAERKNLKIMVDHTFLFTGAVRKIKELVDRKELGDLYYYDALRVNLGLFQHDVNVIWDLAPHEENHCPCERELAVSGQGADHVDRRRKEDAGVERFGGGRKTQDLRQGS